MRVLFAHCGGPKASEITSGLNSLGLIVKAFKFDDVSLFENLKEGDFDLILVDISGDYRVFPKDYFHNALNSGVLIFLINPDEEKDLLKDGIVQEGNYLFIDLPVRQLHQILQLIGKHSRVPSIQEAQYKLLFELSPSGILLSDENGNITDVNSTACHTLGYSKEELLRMNFRQLVPSEHKSSVEQNISRLSTGSILQSEVTNIRKDGTKCIVDLKETRIPLGNEQYGILVVSTDITERRNAEREIIDSEEKYRVVVENANDGIVIAQEDIIVFANMQCSNMLGYGIEEAIGRSIFEFISQEKRTSVKRSFEKWLKSQNSVSIFETDLIKKDESLLQVEMNSRIINYQNKPSVIILIRDISDRVKSHIALLESELSYKSIFDHASDAIYVQNKEGIFLDVNPAAMKMYGYTREEMIGNSPAMLSPPGMNDLNETIKSLIKAFDGIPQRFEWWGMRKNGEIFPKEVVMNKGNYFGKEVVFAMARDITERYSVLEALKESEDKYRSLTSQLPVGVYRSTPDGQLVYSNPALVKILGYNSVEELLKLNVEQLYVYVSDRKNQFQAAERTTEIIQSEFQLRKKSGDIIWVRDNSRLILNKQGQPEYFDGVLEEITLQKAADKALLESESKLKATLRANPDLMFRFDSQGNFTDYHSNFDQNLYIDNESIIGSNVREHFSEEVALETIDSIKKCLETGEMQTMEYSLDLPGGVKYFEARHVAVDSDEVLSFARDITEQRRREEEIRMMARALMSVNDCVTITDKQNNLLFVNEKFTEIYGYEKEEVIGKNIIMLRAENLEEVENQILISTIAGGWKGELLNRRKDGTVFPIQLSTSAVKDDNNNVLVLIGVSNDISEQKRAEQELIEAKERAEESDKLKSAFLANMSHEIRSPMNGILGFAHLLKDEGLSVTARQYVEMITNSGNHLLAVINDIIDISKIQANQLKISYSEVNLNLLVEELYMTFSYQVKSMDNHLLNLHKAVPENDTIYKLNSDMVRLRQIFFNLLSNALKFTTEGLIVFGFQAGTKDEIEFFVKDTGVGIPYEFQSVLFERFRQADDSLSRSHGGAGLGLAISKGLVELMGGKMWFDSKPERGSSFYFSLPVNS
jgi:PAS domain S-box-containing protein